MINSIYGYFNIPRTEKILETNIFGDTRKFVDPLKIDRGGSQLNCEMSHVIQDFYDTYINDCYRVLHHPNKNEIFKEPSENHLGYCENGSKGKAGGEKLIKQLLGLHPKLVETKVLHFRRIPFWFDKVKDDNTSDLTTRIIFKQLAEYTLSICRKYNINTRLSKKIYYWNHDVHNWDKMSFELPYNPNGEVILFIPNDICSSRVSMGNFRRFVALGIVNYIRNNWKLISLPIEKFEISPKMTKKQFVEELAKRGMNVYDRANFDNLDEQLRDNILVYYERIL